MASECAGQLPPLPIVAYAISLSMGVSYRQLRSSRLITHFNRAKASLEASCALLEDLSADWYSAEAMARLGRKALLQIDAEQTLEGTAAHGQPPDSGGGAAEGRSTLTSANTTPNISGTGPVGHEPDPGHKVMEVDSVLAPVARSNDSECEKSMGSPLEEVGMNDLDSSTMHGFADIDTLFGEFLDLSLPTNFWDPIFAKEDPSGSQGS